MLTEAICNHFLLTATRINLDDTVIKTAVPLYASAFSVTDTSGIRLTKQREKNSYAEAALANKKGNL